MAERPAFARTFESLQQRCERGARAGNGDQWFSGAFTLRVREERLVDEDGAGARFQRGFKIGCGGCERQCVGRRFVDRRDARDGDRGIADRAPAEPSRQLAERS